jgi:hypothetical protein
MRAYGEPLRGSEYDSAKFVCVRLALATYLVLKNRVQTL